MPRTVKGFLLAHGNISPYGYIFIPKKEGEASTTLVAIAIWLGFSDEDLKAYPVFRFVIFSDAKSFLWIRTHLATTATNFLENIEEFALRGGFDPDHDAKKAAREAEILAIREAEAKAEEDAEIDEAVAAVSTMDASGAAAAANSTMSGSGSESGPDSESDSDFQAECIQRLYPFRTAGKGNGFDKESFNRDHAATFDYIHGKGSKEPTYSKGPSYGKGPTYGKGGKGPTYGKGGKIPNYDESYESYGRGGGSRYAGGGGSRYRSW